MELRAPRRRSPVTRAQGFERAVAYVLLLVASVASQRAIDDTTEAEVRVGRTLRDKWHLDGLIDVGGMAAASAAKARVRSRQDVHTAETVYDRRY
jgi:hypothetical protein